MYPLLFICGVALVLTLVRAIFGGWWCRTFHAKSYWPSYGYYQCKECSRRYPVWNKET